MADEAEGSRAVTIPSAVSSSTWQYQVDLPGTDALPYYDDELDRPEMRAKVEAELAREMAKGSVEQIGSERLPPTWTLFASRPDLAEEVERIGKGGTTNALDTQRYRLPDPVDHDNVETWQDAVRNAEVQLCHADLRMTNLDLLKRFGSNAWRLYNFQQEANVRRAQAAVAVQQSTADQINRKRKAKHEALGADLTRANKRWVELLNHSLSVDMANEVAQLEVEALEKRKVELQRRLAAMDAA